jgi:polyisoprenoid-binding protein YceI
MNRSIASLAAAALVLVAAPAIAAPRTFAIEADKHNINEASFTSKAAIVKFVGRTPNVSGEAKLDPTDVAKAAGTVSVDLNSLDTGISMRNEHMRGTLESAKYPAATFKFTTIKVTGNKLAPNQPAEGTATGTMTLHGVTKPLTVPVTLTLIPETDAKYRAGDWVHVESSFKIKMTEYGITMPPSVLGVKVADDQEINVDVMAKAK